PISMDSLRAAVRLPFEVHPPHPAFSCKNTLGYPKRLRGDLIILDDGDCDDDLVKEIAEYFGDGQLRYVLAYELSEASKAVLSAKKITSFELRELKEIAGGQRSSLNIPMERGNVGGVLTVLEQERIKQYAQHQQFIYFLLSGIGS